ncbi:MAG: site-2 protease family protein [Myxococcaceae bacterium]|nr:site-2 protease family protein [Myxococcaceae bacterium]
MRTSLHVATIAGIQVRLHISLLVVLPIFAYLFGVIYLSAAQSAPFAPEVSTSAVWLFGGLMALGLFASVLLHELAHSLYALKKGGQVKEITLMMLGGVSRMTRMPTKPGQEALMAFVGPLTSLTIGLVSLALTRLVPAATSFPAHFGLFYFGYLNLFLGLFNLLPAFPMDGGRILRALLTRPLGRSRATRVAATVGRVFAALLFVLALFTVNFILMLVALFIWFGAEAERQSERLQSAIKGVRVRQVMRLSPTTIDKDASLEDAFAAMRAGQRDILFAIDEQGALVGTISLTQIAALPLDRRAQTAVGDIAAPATNTLSPDEPLTRAIDLFGERGRPTILPVLDASGRLIGALDQDDLSRGLRFLQIEANQQALDDRRVFSQRKEENP